MEFSLFLIILLILASLWELVWKGIALWRCGRNNHLAWYVCILIFNTLGLLPIIYLLLNPGKRRK